MKNPKNNFKDLLCESHIILTRVNMGKQDTQGYTRYKVLLR